MTPEELSALQETATTLRATADTLKGALTDTSTADETAAAAQADTDATSAETAYTDAKAAADAAAGGSEEAAQPKAGDTCTLEDGVTEGILQDDGSGTLTCVAKPVEEKSEEETEDTSRTGFVEGRPQQGDDCVCPDGRKGKVSLFAGGLAVCLPSQGFEDEEKG